MDLAVAKKLVPVVSVNIIGLVFNTLCLRDVEASFFQVMCHDIEYRMIKLNLINFNLDCKRARPASHNSCFLSLYTIHPVSNGRYGRSCCNYGIYDWGCTIFVAPCHRDSVHSIALLWGFFLPLHRLPRGVDQELLAIL